ncbi:hypothetical protein [Nonomuraea sp. NPDC005501]|uniref:hypothetical protein n=1 Tax=Nonomuraea sp. NPDC005501 TaxID=3156884 RepID=UPI0033BD13E2
MRSLRWSLSALVMAGAVVAGPGVSAAPAADAAATQAAAMEPDSWYRYKRYDYEEVCKSVGLAKFSIWECVPVEIVPARVIVYDLWYFA